MARTFDGYRLSPKAEADLESIYAYSVRNWSVEQATRYLDEMESALTALASGRRIGHVGLTSARATAA